MKEKESIFSLCLQNIDVCTDCIIMILRVTPPSVQMFRYFFYILKLLLHLYIHIALHLNLRLFSW